MEYNNQHSIIETLSSLKKDDIKIIGIAKMSNGKELIIEKTLQVFVTIGKGVSTSSTTYPLEKYKHCIQMFDQEYSLKDLKSDQNKLDEFCDKIK